MIEIGQKFTEQGSADRKSTDLLADSYDISGPIGSQGPKLVVDEDGAYDKLNDQKSHLAKGGRKGH